MDTTKMPGATVHICQDRDDLSKCLADAFVQIGSDAIAARGRFTVALSGGSTPKSLYSLLGQERYKSRIDWTMTHLFWGDERCVPHDSPESNYKMALESLIAQINIPEGNVHPTAGQDSDPQAAARDYEAVLKRIFQLSAGSLPSFDLILLGLGPDGHTASLFPGTEALKERERLVVANYVEKFKSYRITFTLPVLNAAHHVQFMVAGEDKKDMLPEVLKSDPVIYPAQLIQPGEGALEWYVDKAAAQNLDLHALAGR
jgi:6-phosphogluconolactonase